MLRRFLSEESGQTATEYMLLVSVVVIAIAVVGARYVPLFGEAVNTLGMRVLLLLSFGRE